MFFKFHKKNPVLESLFNKVAGLKRSAALLKKESSTGILRSSGRELFCKRRCFRNLAKFTGKHLCQRFFFFNFFKKETLAQVFSCEFCEISKNTFYYRTPLVAAFVFSCEIGEIFRNTFFYRTPLVADSDIKKVFNFQRFLLSLAFCLKHVALQIIQISFTSNGD